MGRLDRTDPTDCSAGHLAQRAPGRPPVGRIAVIGDVGGHRDELVGELVRLGADPRSLALPADLTVIQVGDLVHRGPDSEGVIALVDRYLRTGSGRWIQLVGNHEAQYLRPPAFDWPQRLADSAVDTLRSWWSNGWLRAAAAVRADRAVRAGVDGAGAADYLITHAGLTEGYWRQVLGAPVTAAAAAAALNSFIGTHDDVLFAPGQMLGGGGPNALAGPIWASSAGEVVPSWAAVGTDAPFCQIHGHSGVVDWRRRALRIDPGEAVSVEVDEVAAHATVTVAGQQIIGVDPGHSSTARTTWRALVLADARIESVPST